MIKKESSIDPNILRQNIEFLDKNDYYISKVRGHTTKDQLLKHSTDISKRSITPDTHKSRTLVQNDKELQIFDSIKKLEIIEKQIFKEELMMSQEDQDLPFYVDEYQYKDSPSSHVLHFGINTLYKPLKEEIINYNNTVKEAITRDLTDQITDKVQKFFVSIITNMDLKNNEDILKQFEKIFKETKETKKEEKFLNKCVKLFLKTHTLDEFINYTKTSCNNIEVDNSLELKILDSISTSKSQISLANTQNYIDISKNISHLANETTLIKSAVEYFTTNPNRKTILLDIFERNLQTTLIEDIKKTHTIVLYNTGTKILVIDPSNPQFSSHLANFANYMEVSYSGNDKYKIYQPPDKADENGLLGSNPSQWRDCIDIAVKLAFGFNNTKIIYKTVDEIIASDIAKRISNNPDIDRSIIVKDLSARIKQASDINQVEKFDRIEKIIDKNIQMTKNFHPKVCEYIKESYKKIISNIDYGYSTIEQKLLHLNQDYICKLSGELNAEQSELLEL